MLPDHGIGGLYTAPCLRPTDVFVKLDGHRRCNSPTVVDRRHNCLTPTQNWSCRYVSFLSRQSAQPLPLCLYAHHTPFCALFLFARSSRSAYLQRRHCRPSSRGKPRLGG